MNKYNEKDTTEYFHDNVNLKEEKLRKFRGTTGPKKSLKSTRIGLLYAKLLGDVEKLQLLCS